MSSRGLALLERARYERFLAAGAEMDEASWFALWKEGSAVTPEQAVAFASTASKAGCMPGPYRSAHAPG
jgi:hypothetical protein